MKSWIKANESLFKNLIPGKIYTVFENEKPVVSKGKPIYTIRYTKTGRTLMRVSKKGNVMVNKIALCEVCGKLKAGRKIRSSLCAYHMKLKTKEMLKNRHKTHYQPVSNKSKKLKPALKLTAKEIAYAITGDYPRVVREGCGVSKCLR